MIPYSRQSIDKADIKSVINVLKSDFLTQGPLVEKFEIKIKKFCGVKFATAVNSATSALHISCLALGLKKMIICGHHQFHLLLLLIVAYIVEQKLILLI